jgi:hypothetical protein
MRYYCYKIFPLSLLISMFVIISGCEAPRNNPLDPDNPANKYQYMLGEVKSVSIPYHPIMDVLVHWPDISISTTTDQSGQFSIELIDADAGWLQFIKKGYHPDSTYVSWQDSDQHFFEIFLNAHTVMENCEVFSVIENRYPSLQTELMLIFFELCDVDNDIDSVFLDIPIIEQTHLLPYNTTNKRYERTFSLYDFDITSLDQLTGHPLFISVTDIFNQTINLDISPINRVIRDEIIFIAPSGNEVTTANPNLSWELFTPGFSHTYSLEVFTSEITPTRVWHEESLPDSLFEYTVDSTLIPGEYFWVIWAIDEFGNRTRSKPASFQVQ